MCDNDQGIELAFKHFVGLGHKKIGFVGDIRILDFRRRYESYIQCHKRYHLEFDIERVYNVGDPGFQGGWEAASQFLERDKNASAIIVGSDLMAVSFIERVKSFGLRVPEDIAVIGFDASSMGVQKEPQLTSIDQNISGLVDQAFQTLIDRLDGKPYHPTPSILPCQLRVLDSCGAEFNKNKEADNHDVSKQTQASAKEHQEEKRKELKAINNYESSKFVAFRHRESVMSLSFVL